ncbi:MAG: sensor histidine kinase [Rhodospirillum sp.]|nr:sensor histidine kinase [Rhodospirillum sp.]MCF8490506.1 sensor histidine kinase [Rhodospirillum sp.]MCF8500637.1 sensor histidine kinase [Rhodospirillum sp.]
MDHIAYQNRVQTWAFPTICLGLLTVVGTAYFLVTLFDQTVEERATTERVQADGRSTLAQIGAAMEEYARLMMITANSPVLTEGSEDKVARLLLTIAKSDQRIDQLRLLSPNGMEVVRINDAPDSPIKVPRDNLQDKSDRPYFKATVTDPKGTLRISPLDLNIEFGKVEYPLTPTIRLSTPIFWENGRIRGVLVLNINAGSMVGQVQRKTQMEGEWTLIHVGGSHWVLPDKTGERGWVLTDTDQARARYPEVVARMNRVHQGSFQEQGILWFHGTQDLETELPRDRLISDVRGFPIIHVFVGAQRPFLAALLANRLPVAALAAALSLAVAWAWSRALIGQARARRARAQAYKRLVQSEKLAGLGGMVAGIAHELNTPIGNALTIASTIQDRALEAQAHPAALDLPDFLDDMSQGSTALLRSLDRARTLIRRFKDVAVDRTAERRRPFALDPFLEDLLATMRPRFRTSPITLTLEANSKATMDSYPGALGQVVMNLIDNAQTHGFPEGAAGEIRVTATLATPDKVRLICADSGQGIEKRNLPRLFEPFFTTRPSLGGGGLGLAITHGIVVDLLGGEIMVTSSPGKGTAFIIDLPWHAPEKSPPSEKEQDRAVGSQ